MMKTLKHFDFLRHKMWMQAPIIGLAALVAAVSTPAQAGGFLLAPTRIFFDGSSRAQELTIMNQSDRTQTYRFRLEDRRLKENGEYDVITDPADPIAASQMLRLSARQVVVPARASATVRVLLRKPAGLAVGEVRSHLIVTELPIVGAPVIASEASPDITVSITTIYGISIPILVRTGELSARVTSVTPTRVVSPERPELENVVVKVDATGNRSVFLDLRIVSTRNRRSPPISVAKSFAIYAPLGPRLITLTLNAEETAKARAGNVVLQYQEVNRDGTPIGAVSEVAF
jgi:hypothetical protein